MSMLDFSSKGTRTKNASAKDCLRREGASSAIRCRVKTMLQQEVFVCSYRGKV